MTIFRARAVLLLLTLFLAHSTFAADARDASQFFSLNMGDLKVEANDARASGKKALLLVFEQEGCPYCRYMRQTVLNRSDVQDYYGANFVTFSIDIWSSVPLRDFAERDLTEKTFAHSVKVRATPTFVFYDLSGHEVTRIVGTVDTPEEFLLLGEFVASGAYRNSTFAEYRLKKSARHRT